MAKNKNLQAAQEAYKRGKRARNNAKKKGIVTSQKPKQKKKKVEQPRSSAPKSSPRSSQPSQKKPSYSTSYKPPTSLKPKAPKTNVTKSYNSYKKSSFAPKVTDTTKQTTLQQAQAGYDAYQKAKAKQQKNNVVGTERPKNESNVISDFSKPKNYDYKKDLQKAAKKGRETTYLGTKQEDVTVELATKKEKAKQLERQKTQYYKSKEWKATKDELKKQNRKAWRESLKTNLGWSDEAIDEWMKSEDGKELRKESYTEMKDSVKKDINKSIRHSVHEANTLESVNALTKGEFNKMVTASTMGKEKGNKFLGKELAEKVGSKTVEAGLRSKGAYGFMQGMSKADIWSGGVGTYNEGARTGMEQVKNSGSYMVGYGAGLAADMMMGGVASRGASLSQGATKLAGNLMGKGLPEKTAIQAAEEFSKLSASKGAKKFLTNRAGELVAETPTNILDAAKMSMDADGNIDSESFRNWMLINSAFTVGMGGAMEGIGAGLTKKMANQTADLLAKKEAGTITKEETQKLAKNIEKLTKKSKNEVSLSGDVARDEMVNVRGTENRMKYMNKQTGKGLPETANAKQQGKFYGGGKGGRLSTENKFAEEQARKEANNFARNPERATTEAEVSARKEVAERQTQAVPRTTEKARLNEVRRLNAELDELRSKLSNAEKEAKKNNTIQGHQKAVNELEQIRKDIKLKEEQVKRANRNTLSGRLGAAGKEKKRAKTLGEYETASRKYEAVEKDLKADAEAQAKERKLRNAVKKAEAEAKANPTPENKARAELGREALEKAKAKTKSATEKAFDDAYIDKHIREMSPKDIADRIKYLEDNLPRAKADRDNALKEHRRGFTEKNYRSDHYNTAKVYNMAKENYLEMEAELEQLKQARGILEESGIDFKALETPKVEAKAEAPKKSPELTSDGYAKLPDEELDEVGLGEKKSLPKEKKEVHTLKDFQEKTEQVKPGDKTPKETKKEKVKKADGKLKTQLKQLKKDWDKLYNAFVSELAPFERMAMQSADKQSRKLGRVSINKMLVARAKALEKIRSEGDKIFTSRNLHKDSAKAEAYDTYVLLMHDLDRLKQKSINARTKNGEKIWIDFARKKITKVAPNGETVNLKFSDYAKDIDPKWKFEDMSTQDILDFCKRNDLDIDGKIRDKSYSGLTKEEINDVLRDIEKQYDAEDVKAFQKELVNYHHDLLKMDAEAGIISKQEMADLEKFYPNYVPAYREGDIDRIVQEHPVENIYVARLFEAKGSEDMKGILPLYTQMVAKTNMVTKRAAENEMLNVIAKINGMSPQELPRGRTPNELIEVTSGVYRADDGRHMVYFRQDGKGVSMEVSEEAFHALRQWSGAEKAAIMDFKIGRMLSDPKLQKAAMGFKAWITDYSIIFGARNFVRDTATALVYSERPTQWLRSFPKAVMGLTKKDSLYAKAVQQYIKDGGRYNALVTSTDISKVVKAGKKDGIPGLRIIKDFNTALETLPRMSEYIATVERLAKKEGCSFEEALKKAKITDEAMYNAKEVTLNFDRAGQYGRILNRGAVPFFNPSIQGLDKLFRVLLSDNRSMKEFMEMGAKMGGGVIAPAVAWELLVGKNEDYQKLSAYNKYTYFCIPFGKNDEGDPIYIKIPRAREVSAMQMPIDWFMQNVKYQSRDGEANLFKSFSRSFSLNPLHPGLAVEQIGPVNPVSDNLISPLFNLARNRDWMGYNVESNTEREEKRFKGNVNDIYDSDTSTAALTIQTMINNGMNKGLDALGIGKDAQRLIKRHQMSPKQLDQIFDSYLGVIYDIGLRPFSQRGASMKGISKDPMQHLSDWATSSFGTAFVVNGTLSNSRRTEMYAKLEDYRSKLDKLPKGSDEYNETQLKLNQLNNNVAYDVQALDVAVDTINRNKKLSQREKSLLTAQIKREQNSIIDDFDDGKNVVHDPLKYLIEMKDKNGKKVFTTEQVLQNFTYTIKEGENKGKNTIRDSWDVLKESDYYKKHPKKAEKEFLDVTFSTREVAGKCGEGKSFMDYTTMAVVCADKNKKNGKSYDEVLSAYNVYDSQKKAADIYINQMGGSKETFTASHKRLVEGAAKLGLEYTSQLKDHDYAMILANATTKNGNKMKDRAYFIEDNKYGTSSFAYIRMNPARCLSSDKYEKSNWTYKKVHKFAQKYKLGWDSSDKKIVDAINEKYPNKTKEEKAALFQVIKPTDDNPFGEIGDYSVKGDTGYDAHGGGHGWGRRGGRRGHGGGGGGGGSGSGTPFTPLINEAGKKAKITQPKFKSNLDDAYRKKVKKLREKQNSK